MNWYRICLAIYPTHIQLSSFVSYCVQTFVSLSLTTHDFLFWSPTVEDELSRQPCRQPPHSTLGYPIQSTSLFNQTFSSISNHFPESIGNFEGLLNHLVGPRPSRSSALYVASWISHYVGLPLSNKAGKSRPYSLICRHHYIVAIEG